MKKLEDLDTERAAFSAAKARSLESIKAEVEESKRREWELKARLEITRQVSIETEKLKHLFEVEVEARVKIRVKQIREQESEIPMIKPPSPPLTQPPSFAIYTDNDTPSTADLSNLSLDSPIEEKENPMVGKGTTPPKRKPRAPLARSRTQMDSPADVIMAEPSPMSIACLSLSPRRTAAATAASIPNSKNIFAAAAAQKSRLHQQLQTPSSIDQAIIDEEEDDDEPVPELPSPTRAPVSSDPFKAPMRPGLLRQKTAPINRLPHHQPSLFPSNRPPRGPSPPNPVRPPMAPSANTTTAAGSPTRKAGTGTENEMFKKIMHRNLNGRGRTLVELEQARYVQPQR